jgi:nucleotide-binding universal stress UspA family protein
MTMTTNETVATTATEQATELRIVVGVDGSECGQRALDFAAREAARWGAMLQIVSAYEVPASAGWVAVPLDKIQEAAAEVVSDALNRVHEIEPSVVVKVEHDHGFPGNVLVDVSRGATMLIVGCRGRGEVASLIIGSVSEYCVHHATCPITVVH